MKEGNQKFLELINAILSLNKLININIVVAVLLDSVPIFYYDKVTLNNFFLSFFSFLSGGQGIRFIKVFNYSLFTFTSLWWS